MLSLPHVAVQRILRSGANHGKGGGNGFHPSTPAQIGVTELKQSRNKTVADLLHVQTVGWVVGEEVFF